MFTEIFREWFFITESNLYILAAVVIVTGVLISARIGNGKSRIMLGVIYIAIYGLSSVVLYFSETYAKMFLSLFIGGAAVSLFIGHLIYTAGHAIYEKRKEKEK